MGDPTLRMHVVAPPSPLVVATNSSNGVNLSWNSSTIDTVLGWLCVSWAPTAAGPFTRLTTNLLTGTSYTGLGGFHQRIHGARREISEVSGSVAAAISNAIARGSSRASMVRAFGAPPSPCFNRPTPPSSASVPPVQLCADTVDPAKIVTNVVFYANDVQIGQASSPPYTMTWSNVPGGSYALSARAVCSTAAKAATSGIVNVGVDNLAVRHCFPLPPLGRGMYSIFGNDFFGRTYQIQFLNSTGATNWQTLGPAMASPSGVFQYLNTNQSPQGFYRTVFP